MSAIDKNFENDELSRWVREAMDEPAQPASVDVEAKNDKGQMLDVNRREIMLRLIEFKEMLMRNACAIKEIRTKLEILNTEYALKHHRNPIHSINTRLKSMSILTPMLDILLSLVFIE